MKLALLKGMDPREKGSTGVIVKAVIFNGPGFASAPLYLFGQFFQGKAIETLLREVVKPDSGMAWMSCMSPN